MIGADSERARIILRELYSDLQRPMVVADVTTAELIKHAANAFLSTKISFINMVADICDAVGADVTRVAEGLGLDPRISPSFLQAGIGFGGYCFPKDLRALAHLAEQQGVDCSLLRAVERINIQRVGAFLEKVRNSVWVISGKTLGVLGLAFKPNTDDIREAPSLRILEALLKEGANLRLHDPWAMPAAKTLYPSEAGRITYCESPYEAARGADALLLLTGWNEYRNLDLARLRDQMQVPVLIDGRNFFSPEQVREAGFSYTGMGPRSVYDEAKRFSEAMAMAYLREHGVKVRIVRIFNTYGERMRADDGRALPTFLSQALLNKPVTVYGDGTQTRSFCYVSDLVEGLYRLLLSDLTGPVNLGNPDEITLLELARNVIEQTASRSKIVFEPLPVDDPMRRRPDISRAFSRLMWQPRVSLREGIDRVIPYFKSQLGVLHETPAQAV